MTDQPAARFQSIYSKSKQLKSFGILLFLYLNYILPTLHQRPLIVVAKCQLFICDPYLLSILHHSHPRKIFSAYFQKNCLKNLHLLCFSYLPLICFPFCITQEGFSPHIFNSWDFPPGFNSCHQLSDCQTLLMVGAFANIQLYTLN